MAIYMLSVKHKAKGKGASATAHAQYIQREGKYAGESHAEYLERGGKHKKRAHELESTWTENLPKWANSPKKFWETADIYERANGRVYTEVVVALPRELSKDEREKLVREFIGKEIGEHFTYTAAIHNPKALDGGEQPHAHIMFSVRERDGIERTKEQYFKRANPDSPEKGGAKKSREWSKDSRANDRVNEMRSSWEELTNTALQRAGREERIDRRTLQAQGIDREPEPKMGVEVTQRLKRGQESEIGGKVIELRNYRREERELKELEQELKKEKAKVLQFGELGRQNAEENVLTFTKAAGQGRRVSEEEQLRYQRTLDLVLDRKDIGGGRAEYHWKRSGRLAFTDHGETIVFNNISETSVKAGLQLSKQKGWEGVQVSGSEEFRRENWIQGELMGISIYGYEPQEKDFSALEERKRAEEIKKTRYQKNEPEKDRPQELGKGFQVLEISASDLVLKLKHEIIPELQTAKTKTLHNLRGLGYEGSPENLLYIHGAFERWKNLPTDAELRERTLEILGGSSYRQQKEQFQKADEQVIAYEKKLEKLDKETKKTLIKKISLLPQKKRDKEELMRALKWKKAAEEEMANNRQKLSTGDNKERFHETYERLMTERLETEKTRTTTEKKHGKLSLELTEAYQLKQKLETLGRTKVRFIFENGRVVRPENEVEFKRELSRVKELSRNRSRGGRGL
jgi:hypothetical protein